MLKRFAFFLASLVLLTGGVAEAQTAGRLRLASSVAQIEFGNLTWAGYGRDCSLGLAPGLTIAGPDAAYNDFGQDADGCIVPEPSLSYGTAPSFGKPAGSTYQLLFGSTAVNIALNADQLFLTNLPTDTDSNWQLENVLLRTFGTAGAVQLGQTIVLRTGTTITNVSNSWAISAPAGGWKGAWSSIAAGSGYTNGTHANLTTSNVSGSMAGSGMLVVATVSGTGVTQIHVNDWGNKLYQAGDVLTAAVPGGGSGFTFTLSSNINDNGIVVIRSQTPDTTTMIDGNLRYGGDATIEGIEFGGAAGDTHYRLPFEFRYVDFVWSGLSAPPNLSAFVTYRQGNGIWSRWGVGGKYNFCSIENQPAAGGWNRDCFQVRMATWEYNHVYKVDNAFNMTGANVAQPQTTQTVANRNVIHDIWIDCVKTNGLYNRVNYNHCYDWKISTSGGAHGDGLQHLGITDGLEYTDVLSATGNIWDRGSGTTNKGNQGTISADSTGTTRLGGTYRNNFQWGPGINAMSLTRYRDPVVNYNTLMAQWDPPNFSDPILNAKVRLLNGNDGTVSRNLANDYEYGTQTGFSFNASINPTVTVSEASFDGVFANGDWGPFTTRAQFLAARTPKSTGAAVLGDGTVAGALFPACPGETIGAWNDGTVWDCTDPVWLAAHPPAT